MTPQEIFDTVATHLATQAVRAYDPDGPGCVYRGPDGLKCAAGALIPDKVYQPRMEGSSAIGIAGGFKKILPAYFIENAELIDRLQVVHDEQTNWDEIAMPERLGQLAAEYDLDASILETLDFSRIAAEAQRAAA